MHQLIYFGDVAIKVVGFREEAFLGLSGIVWDCLGLCGILWCCLGLSGVVLLGLYGSP